MTQVTINGNAYSDDGSTARDLRADGHRLWLLPMLQDLMVITDAALAVYGDPVANLTATGTVILGGASGAEGLRVNPVTSAVNRFQIQGAVAGAVPSFAATGTDSNVSAGHHIKGTGEHVFYGGSSDPQFKIAPFPGAVNYTTFNGGSAASSTVFQFAAGASTNIKMMFMSKGTSGLEFNTNGSALQFTVAHTASAVNYAQVTGNSAGGNPIFSAQGADADLYAFITGKGTGGGVKLATNNGNQLQVLVSHAASAVNYWQLAGRSAGNGVQEWALGSDANVHALRTTNGTGVHSFWSNNFGAEQFRVGNVSASAVNYLMAVGNVTLNYPAMIGQGSDSNIGMSVLAKGSAYVLFGTGYGSTATQMRVAHISSSVNYIQVYGGATSNAAVVSTSGSDTNVYMNYLTKGSGNHNFVTGGTELQAVIAHIPSAVNYWKVQGAATAGGLYLSSVGADTDTFNSYSAKGSGAHAFYVNSAAQFRIGAAASAVNYWQATGSATGFYPVLSIQGSDTNPDAIVTSKGSGSVKLSTNGANQPQLIVTHTVNSVNYNVMTGGATGSLAYHGVNGNDSSISMGIYTKGSGGLYLQTNGGTNQAVIAHTASAVNVTQMTGGATGNDVVHIATGSDANVYWQNRVKGAGYHQFRTNNSDLQFTVAHLSGATECLSVVGGTASSTPTLYVAGASADDNINILAKGAGYLNLGTGTYGTGIVQARVTHTTGAVNYTTITGGDGSGTSPTIASDGSSASPELYAKPKGSGRFRVLHSDGGTLLMVSATAASLNYLAVSGAATGASPYVAVAGTDAAVGVRIGAKGVGSVSILTGSIASGPQFTFTHTASAVNYLQATGAIAGDSPAFSAAGSDANVGIKLVPKGTEYVWFGTHTASADVAITGYITIKDSAGNLRKLAVIA